MVFSTNTSSSINNLNRPAKQVTAAKLPPSLLFDIYSVMERMLPTAEVLSFKTQPSQSHGNRKV